MWAGDLGMNAVCVSIKPCNTEKLLEGSEIMNAKMLFTSSRAESHVSAILLFIFMHKVNHFFCINFQWVLPSI